MSFRCFGVTGNRSCRCLRDGQPLYCPEHAPQPYIALASAIFGFFVSVVASLLANQIFISTVETDLKPSDFDVEIVSRRHAGDIPFEFEPPELLHIPVVVGSILIDATLKLDSRGEAAYTGGRNPWKYWHFPSKRLNLTMNKRVTLESLVGQRVSARIPVRVLHPKSVNEFKIWIRGKQTTLNPDANGDVEYSFTKEYIEN